DVRVRARLRHELYADEVDRYAELGLEAEEGEKAPTGTVTREQLVELVREHDVQLVEAAATAEATEAAEAPADADSAKAEADEPKGGEAEDTATASAGSASDA
ncbi:MAG: hypothetical protein ACOCUS_04400, partial [Polyangiales bacterium]